MCNAVLVSYLKSSDFSNFKKFYDEIPSLNQIPDVLTYSLLVEAYLLNEKPKSASILYSQHIEKENFHPEAYLRLIVFNRIAC